MAVNPSQNQSIKEYIKKYTENNTDKFVKYIFNMIVLVVDSSNTSNSSLALDTYFGYSDVEIKNWLKGLHYSSIVSLKEFQEMGGIVSDEQIQLVLVGANKLKLKCENKNIIIYPFDKLSPIKNQFIKEVLSNQLQYAR